MQRGTERVREHKAVGEFICLSLPGMTWSHGNLHQTIITSQYLILGVFQGDNKLCGIK